MPPEAEINVTKPATKPSAAEKISGAFTVSRKERRPFFPSATENPLFTRE